MFEEYTYENMMATMLEEAPDNVDVQEGSLLWNSCSKMAMLMEEFFEKLGENYDNMEVDTQDLDHLIDEGAEAGCPIIEATAAVFTMQLNCTCAIGDKFQNTDYDYIYTVIATLDESNHIYSVECEDDGAEPNAYLGYVNPVEFLEGFESGQLTALTTPGEDQEDEEAYRTRRANFYKVKPFAGNREYYKSLVNSITGVGGCRALRAASSGGKISVIIINSSYTAPNAELINTVQEALDPLDKTGEGEGSAPIGAEVIVTGVTPLAINISASITFETGISYSDVESYVQAAVDTYFQELGKTWADQTSNITVRVSQIENRLMDIEGIMDITNIKLNNTAANLQLSENVVPSRGEITCS